MTRQTRRRVSIAVVVLVLTLPVEALLFQAMVGDPADEVQAWVDSLSDAELEAAAANIYDYSLPYRRGIMTALPPTRRSDVWRAHIQGYRDRPATDSSAVPALDAAFELASSVLLDGWHPEMSADVADVAEQLIVLIGRDDTEYLLYRLGPTDGTFASADPIRHRLINWVRRVAVVLAREDQCSCNTGFGCDGPYECNDTTSCEPDTEWPMCGWLWSEVCDGSCENIGEGGDS